LGETHIYIRTSIQLKIGVEKDAPPFEGKTLSESYIREGESRRRHTTIFQRNRCAPSEVLRYRDTGKRRAFSASIIL
jgi:hypothetical protein